MSVTSMFFGKAGAKCIERSVAVDVALLPRALRTYLPRLSPDEAHRRVRGGDFVVQGTNAEVLRFVADLVRGGVESIDVSVQRRS